MMSTFLLQSRTKCKVPNLREESYGCSAVVIVYHPANDSCVLFNRGARRIHVEDIDARKGQEIAPDHFIVLHPGYWRLSVAVGNGNEGTLQRLAEYFARTAAFSRFASRQAADI